MPYIQKIKLKKTGDLSIISIAKGYDFNTSVGLTQTWSGEDVLNCADLRSAFDSGTIQVYSNWNDLGCNLPNDKTIGKDSILTYKGFLGSDPANRCMDWLTAQCIIAVFCKIETAKQNNVSVDEDEIISFMDTYHKLSMNTSTSQTIQENTSVPNANMPKGTSLSDHKRIMLKQFDSGPVTAYWGLKIPNSEKKNLIEARQKFVGFFKDADITVSRRMFDTTMRTAAATGLFGAKRYIIGYLECIDHPMKDIIIPKLESDEFKTALFDLTSTFGVNNKPINTRFKIYYGDPSGGKTYQAVSELTHKEYVFPCSSDVTPDVLMREFDFNNGQPSFNQSLLSMAAQQGETIVFEELRLLPQVSLCFLQNMLDNKDCFWYEKKKFDINPNFKVIGTMNLVVNGHVNPLPEALVDRAYEIKRFDITDDCYDVSYDFE